MLKFYTFRKRSLQYLGLALVFAFSAAMAQGQSVTITGKVTDSETQQGLPGASVLVVGTTTGTVTDVNGDFSITVDQAGPIKLAVSFVGYASATIDVNTSNGSTAPLSISLKPDFQSLDEVAAII